MSMAGSAAVLRWGQMFPTEPTIPKSKIVDLTAKMEASGRLVWDCPALQGSASGEWTVVRFSHTLPARRRFIRRRKQGWAECDKLSKEAIEAHYNAMIVKLVGMPGRWQARHWSPPVDSCEHGAQNWTRRCARNSGSGAVMTCCPSCR